MENASQPVTANPQEVAQPQDTTTGTGFQDTVQGDNLNDQAGTIAVEQTGEPVTSMQVSSVKESTTYVWVFVGVFVVIVGIYLLIKLLRESRDEIKFEDDIDEVQVVEEKVKKEAIKKKTTKKKSAPNQRRKKVSKAKR